MSMVKADFNHGTDEDGRFQDKVNAVVLQSIHTQMIAGQIALFLGVLIMWCYFRQNTGITWLGPWIGIMLGCCLLLLGTTICEWKRKCGGRLFLRHHQIFIVVCGLLTGAGMLQLFRVASGHDYIFLVGIFMAVFSSGAYTFSRERRLSFIWVAVLGIPALTGVFLQGREDLLIGIVFLVYLAYLLRNLNSIDRSYHEFVELKLLFEERSRRLYESESNYRLIMENSQDMISIYDLGSHRYTYMSPAVLHLRGFTPEEAVAQPAEESLDADSFHRILASLPELLQQSLIDPYKGYFARYNFTRKDGSLLDMEVNASFMRNAEGQITGILSVCRDATQHAEIERQSELISLLLREFEDSSSDWIWKVDAERRLTYVPPRVAALFHRSVEELAGIDALEAMKRILPKNTGDLCATEEDLRRMQELEDRMKVLQPFRDMLLRVWIEGRPIWWSITGKPTSDVHGSFSGWQGVCRDVTRLREQEEALEWQASHDNLTGAFNNYKFHQRLAELLPVGERRPVLALIHFDRLNAVNTLFGTAVGDNVLRHLTSRMELFAGECGGQVYRLRATDFVLLVSNAPDGFTDELKALAPVFHQPMSSEARDVDVVLRMGAVTITADMTDMKAVEADMELIFRLMKDADDETPIIFNQELADRQHRQQEMLDRLHTATSGDEFFPLYQPQIDVATGRTVGAETLIRWQSPVFGLVPPLEFIQLAEKNGCIMEIGEWVLRRACMDAMKWVQPVGVAVNASAVQLMSPDFVPCVMDALEQSRLPASRLKVEITETAFISDSQRVRETLAALRREGIFISLDDFGTGYASLSYLNQYPIDEIKVDQSFVRTLETKAKSASIVRSIIHLARELNFVTTAEGVETSEQARILEDFGCTHFQGYYFARPITFDDFQKRLEEESAWNEERHAPWRS